jgi:hypothetical protein
MWEPSHRHAARRRRTRGRQCCKTEKSVVPLAAGGQGRCAKPAGASRSKLAGEGGVLRRVLQPTTFELVLDLKIAKRLVSTNTAPSIPGGSKPWVRARTASLALLPQRPRHNERRCSGPARPEHRPAATSRRSLQACIASLPLQSSLMSKTYLKSDHFNGGGSVGEYQKSTSSSHFADAVSLGLDIVSGRFSR